MDKELADQLNTFKNHKLSKSTKVTWALVEILCVLAVGINFIVDAHWFTTLAAYTGIYVLLSPPLKVLKLVYLRLLIGLPYFPKQELIEEGFEPDSVKTFYKHKLREWL